VPTPKPKKKKVKGAPAKEYASAPKATTKSRKANKAARAQAGSFPGYGGYVY